MLLWIWQQASCYTRWKTQRIIVHAWSSVVGVNPGIDVSRAYLAAQQAYPISKSCSVIGRGCDVVSSTCPCLGCHNSAQNLPCTHSTRGTRPRTHSFPYILVLRTRIATASGPLNSVRCHTPAQPPSSTLTTQDTNQLTQVHLSLLFHGTIATASGQQYFVSCWIPLWNCAGARELCGCLLRLMIYFPLNKRRHGCICWYRSLWNIHATVFVNRISSAFGLLGSFWWVAAFLCTETLLPSTRGCRSKWAPRSEALRTGAVAPCCTLVDTLPLGWGSFSWGVCRGSSTRIPDAVAA